VPLRIAFDLDGVLADMDSELVRQARHLFGEAMARRLPGRTGDANHTGAPPVSDDATAETASSQPSDIESSPDNTPRVLETNLTNRQQRKLWRHVEAIENFWETLEELEPGVIGRLAALGSERGWELIFLTKRPETAGATAQVQSQRWLSSKGFALPSVYVVQGSRGRIAAALDLDIVVDDRPENCLDVVVDSRARAILVWRDDVNTAPAAVGRLGIGVVKSVAECLDVLAQIDSAAPDRAGVFDRVKRLLGLGEPTNAV
jgi:hypothetical protein